MASDWVQSVINEDGETTAKPNLQPYAISQASDQQEEAIRELAQQAGFKNLRGFWAWTKSADLDYYDLIKVASPDG